MACPGRRRTETMRRFPDSLLLKKDIELLVSVIIPVYNRQETAVDAINSVVAQTRRPLEIVVVDDGSNPPFSVPRHLRDILTIKVIRHEINRGAAAARNTGLAAALGDWVAFLDSDDRWLPDKLEKQVSHIIKNTVLGTEALICYATDYLWVDRIRWLVAETLVLSARNIDDFASGCWFCPGSTLLVKKSVLFEIGVFNENLRRLEDYEWFLRFGIKGGEVEVIPIIGSLINLSSKPKPEVVEEASSIIYRDINSWSSGHRIPHSALCRAIAYLYLECASANYYAGEICRAALYLMRSFMRFPRIRIAVLRWRRPVSL